VTENAAAEIREAHEWLGRIPVMAAGSLPHRLSHVVDMIGALRSSITCLKAAAGDERLTVDQAEQRIRRFLEQQQCLDAVLRWCVMEQHEGAYRDVGQWLRLALWAMEKGKRVPVPPTPFASYPYEMDPDSVVSAYLAEHSWEQPPAAEHPAAAEIKRLREAIDRDRTGLASALAKVRRTAEGYSWIPDGQWGSYHEQERTDETLRAEVGHCLSAILETVTAALIDSGNLAQRTLFPDRYPDAVQSLSDSEREELEVLRDRCGGAVTVAKREAEQRIRAEMALEEIARLTGLAPGSLPSAVVADVRRVMTPDEESPLRVGDRVLVPATVRRVGELGEVQVETDAGSDGISTALLWIYAGCLQRGGPKHTSLVVESTDDTSTREDTSG